MSQRPDPRRFAAQIKASWPTALTLVPDTNVFINAREAIGYDEATGLLNPIVPGHLTVPDVAVLTATHALGQPLSFIIDDVMQSELRYKIRHGYDGGPWNGCEPVESARILVNLVGIIDGQWTRGLTQPPVPLPDPPLDSKERHDRQIWAQAALANAILVTHDGRLLDAIWDHTGDTGAALTPNELITLI